MRHDIARAGCQAVELHLFNAVFADKIEVGAHGFGLIYHKNPQKSSVCFSFSLQELDYFIDPALPAVFLGIDLDAGGCPDLASKFIALIGIHRKDFGFFFKRIEAKSLFDKVFFVETEPLDTINQPIAVAFHELGRQGGLSVKVDAIYSHFFHPIVARIDRCCQIKYDPAAGRCLLHQIQRKIRLGRSGMMIDAGNDLIIIKGNVVID